MLVIPVHHLNKFYEINMAIKFYQPLGNEETRTFRYGPMVSIISWRHITFFKTRNIPDKTDLNDRTKGLNQSWNFPCPL